jgi:hypothetical protein
VVQGGRGKGGLDASCPVSVRRRGRSAGAVWLRPAAPVIGLSNSHYDFRGGGNSVQRMGRPAQCGRSRVWRSNVRACCEFGHPDAEHAERGAEHAEKITPNRRKPLLWALCAPLGVLCVKGGITSERRRRQFGIRSGSFADLRDSNSWDPPLRRPLPCRAGQSGERRGGKLFPSCHDRPALTRVLVRPVTHDFAWIGTKSHGWPG